MVRNKLYYRLKPFVPDSLRMTARRWFTRRRLAESAGVWPQLPGSEKTPPGWPGWPEGRRFAFVLTHDVEGPAGLDATLDLMRLEQEHGFRSSFNFVPEGGYSVPRQLRREIESAGFEVGVHDLRHDGRLYESREVFAGNARRINRYIEEWGAGGFRSAFMFHRLDWLHDLHIEYDASTFDTDPFEPQPDGAGTIFPHWVGGVSRDGQGATPGYAELPYTLPQDSTLFLLLGHDSPKLWLEKLDWIARHGGMALVNIHPDYIRFPRRGASRNQYSSQIIADFLAEVNRRYAGRFWNPTARELASWYRREALPKTLPAAGAAPAVAPVNDSSASHEKALAGKHAAVLLYSYYPADPRPRRAAEALAASGMTVDLLCLREKPDEPEQETINGVNVFRVPLQKRRDSKLAYILLYARFFLAGLLFLARRGWSGRYSLVHVHNMPDFLAFAALVPRLRGAKVILDLHDPMPELMTAIYGLPADHLAVRVFRWLERASIRFSHLALTPNITFKDLFVSRSCRSPEMQIVMNSPQQEIFHLDGEGGEARRDAALDEFRVMHHGSIVHRHGVDLLVEAVAKVKGKIPGVRLDIYGSRTPFLDVVLDRARELGIADRVHYHGAKSQKDIAKLITDCDVGVVPNRRSPFTEINFPTRLFEYLSMNRPVIAPRTRGIQDYFSGKEMIYFEPDDVENLAAALLWVKEHPAESAQIVRRGRDVYRRHLWRDERARFIRETAALVTA